jgi:hypothetical protein
MRLLTLLLLLPCLSFAQKLKVHEIDKFTNQKRLETERVWLIHFSDGLSISFRSVDSTCFVKFYGYGKGTNVIGEDDKLIFLLDDGTTLSVFPTGLQDYDVNVGTSTYNHQYSISIADLALLSKHNIKSIRKYTSRGYSDFSIPEKKQDEPKKLATLLLKNL